MGQGQWGKEGRMAVAGGSGDSMEQEFKRVGRQGPAQGVGGQLEAI